jgi:hypothetical protein
MAEDQQRHVSAVPLVHGSAAHLTESAPGSPYQVAGEPFYVEIEDGFYYIRHNRWSLVGMGRTIPEAEQDLLSEAEDLRDVLAVPSPVPMDAELERLTAFLHRL